MLRRSRYYLTAVEAWVPASSRAFAIVGDSITDGRGSTTDGNNRYAPNLIDKLKLIIELIDGRTWSYRRCRITLQRPTLLL